MSIIMSLSKCRVEFTSASKGINVGEATLTSCRAFWDSSPAPRPRTRVCLIRNWVARGSLLQCSGYRTNTSSAHGVGLTTITPIDQEVCTQRMCSRCGPHYYHTNKPSVQEMNVYTVWATLIQ